MTDDPREVATAALLRLTVAWARRDVRDDPAAVLTSAVALAARLDRLARTDPAHPVLIAVRAVLDAADARRAEHRARREASHDVHSGDTAYWRRTAALHIPHDELQRRRLLPGPLAPDSEGAA